MKLNEIRDNEGARKSRIRVGRGPGSGTRQDGGRGVSRARNPVRRRGDQGRL